MTHAFFKALLFLGAGSVIHAMGGEQDVTRMGGLFKKIPVTAWTFLIGVLAIAGLPGTSGFVSKDEILLHVYDYSPVMFYFAAFAAILTAYYMMRLFLLTFMGGFRGTHHQHDHLHESPRAMTIPLIILAILSVFGGLIQFPHIFGGHAHLDAYLAPVINPGGHAAVEMHDEGLARREYILLAGTVIGLVLIYMFTRRKYAVTAYEEKQTPVGNVLANKWYVDELYETIIIKPIQWMGKILNGLVEKTGLDGIVNGVGKGLHAGARQLRLLQNGQIGYYLFYMVAGLVFLFVLLRTDWIRIGKLLNGLF
jgi:NADH-quinone oxidoreductase subunit L